MLCNIMYIVTFDQLLPQRHCISIFRSLFYHLLVLIQYQYPCQPLFPGVFIQHFRTEIFFLCYGPAQFCCFVHKTYQTLHLIIRIINLIPFNPIFHKIKGLIQRTVQFFIIARCQQKKYQDSGKNLDKYQQTCILVKLLFLCLRHPCPYLSAHLRSPPGRILSASSPYFVTISFVTPSSCISLSVSVRSAASSP